MGKKLIIKGADFSANGIQYATEDYSTLYDKSNNAVTLADWPLELSDGAYFAFAKNGTGLNKGTNYPGVLTKIAVPEGAISVECSTNIKTGYMSDSVAGFARLIFLDSSDHIISGYASTAEQSQVGTTPVVATGTGYKTINAEIPANAAYICTCYTHDNGNPSPFAAATEFKLVITFEEE